MPRRGENIYKRKDGRWEGRYIKEYVEGKAHYRAVYAKSYREAKNKLDAVKKSQKLAQAKAGSVMTIGNRWLADSAGTLKISSINKYEDILRCYILPKFGNREFSEITNRDLMSFVHELRTSGGTKKQGLAPATVAEILSAMNGLRVYALKHDYNVAFSPECVNVKREQKNIRVFSLEEEKKLFTYLQENMNLTSLGILLCFFTGIRLGELCALQWEDFNMQERQLCVHRTMQRVRVDNDQKHKTEVRIFEPKSSCSIRIIPLPDIIVDSLEDFYTPDAFLLTGQRERFIEPRTMQNRFKSILAACGIANANFHATRHTFATRCIELGFDVKSLSEILGHASVAITMNRYVHPTMALKSENMNRLSELFTVK